MAGENQKCVDDGGQGWMGNKDVDSWEQSILSLCARSMVGSIFALTGTDSDGVVCEDDVTEGE